MTEDVGVAEAFGQWIERFDDRVDDVEASIDHLGSDMGDLGSDLSDVEAKTDALKRGLDTLDDDVTDLEDDVAEIKAQLEHHKRAEFVDSVVDSFADHGAVVTDFSLKDKDGVFLQGGGVELHIQAEATGGDSDA